MTTLANKLVPLARAIVLCAILSACGGDAEGEPIVIRFWARAGSTAIDCTTASVSLGAPTQTMRIADFRFFVSDFRLLGADGAERKLTLEKDGKWQNEATALLDFENATGLCKDFGTSEINTTVRGRVHGGATTHLRFTLGVPFAQNHQLPTSADAPFNLGAMHWDWQAGYKFTRIELADATNTFDWLFHLGSTGCSSSAASVAPKTECVHPNAVIVTLPFDPKKDSVTLDIAAFLANTNLAFNTPNTPAGCLSGQDDPECGPVFLGLGLDPATGRCANGCATQILFRTE